LVCRRNICWNKTSEQKQRLTLLVTACRTLDKAQAFIQGVPHAKAVSLDVSNATALDAEFAKHDLIVSLIPWTHHVPVIESAIRKKKVKKSLV